MIVLDYSVVVPVYNEEESLRPLFAEILQVMYGLKRPYEVIFVNDGSTDKSPQILEIFHQALPDIVRVIPIARSGQTHALRRGLDSVQGEMAITLDADLQNDPNDIPKLLDKMEDGLDCVCGWRQSRQDNLLRVSLSKFGNILQRLFTGLRIHDISCTLRVYKRDCLGFIPLNWEGQHRFIPLSLSLQGYKIGEIVSSHRPRRFGLPKYSTPGKIKVVWDFFRVLLAGGRK